MCDNRLYRRLRAKTYLGLRIKNDVFRRANEERRILARGWKTHEWRTTYLGARMKNDISRHFYGQRGYSVTSNARYIRFNAQFYMVLYILWRGAQMAILPGYSSCWERGFSEKWLRDSNGEARWFSGVRESRRKWCGKTPISKLDESKFKFGRCNNFVCERENSRISQARKIIERRAKSRLPRIQKGHASVRWLCFRCARVLGCWLVYVRELSPCCCQASEIS